MCPNCRAFITINDRVCPYCEAAVGPRAVDLRPNAFAASFLPSANLSAIIVLAINVLFFVCQLALSHSVAGPDQELDYGQTYMPFILQGQWWRLISAGFLHGSWTHLAMNSWSLFILVTEVEQFYGTNRLIVAYVCSTFSGFLCAAIFTPHSPVLGASCAAFGLMGVMLAMGLFGDRADPLTQLVRQHYGQWLVFGLVMSLPFFGFSGHISLSGHIGGLIGGFVIGWIVRLPGHPASPREMFWKIVAYVCIAIVLLCWYKDFAYISYILKHSSGSM
jgi:rhomboid protease GluP